jgi:uncharacterized membrane protein YkvA (DUF1232 family)
VQAQVTVLKLAIFRNLKRWARMLARDVHAVYLAAQDPRVPWYAKVLAAVVAGYRSRRSISFRISFRCWDMPTT